MTKDETMAAQGHVVAGYWGWQEVWQNERVTQWPKLDAVQDRIATEISGNPAINQAGHVIDRYYPASVPVASCVSLGCGEGERERELKVREAISRRFVNPDCAL